MDLQRTRVRPLLSKWLVLCVGSRKEKTVLRSLHSKQIDVFVPLKERHYKYSSKSVVRQLPILPGYVFVNAAKSNIGFILGTPFVYSILKTGTDYSVVTEAEIEHLRRLSSTEHLKWYDRAADEQLLKGDLVEIVRGPLAGVRGRFMASKGRNVFLISFGEQLQTQLGTFEIRQEDVAPLKELATA